MNVETTRFGVVEVDESRVIQFAAGLLGFSSFTRYVLLQPDDDAVFFWLQSVDAPELAFVVTDPSLWVSDYEVPVKSDQIRDIGLDNPERGQVLVIVNKRDNVLTANLQGPLLINIERFQGLQYVMAEKKWSTRHAILELEEQAQAASA